ncbi:MAG: DUF3459 domain-containing protein [bacterium]|nr:DUF3459 domain-containing protein [bacterium]
MKNPWWKEAVFYQIYPRSFCDTSGNGIGDLEGIRSKLDYLHWLGVDALWISPFFSSPMRDYGYDVSDYCGVDPLFGNGDSFRQLINDAHARGLRIIIDWVPNHSSDQHPWFIDARKDRNSRCRGWYVWRDGSPDQPPNNWRAAFSDRPAWTWDAHSQQWYLHLFLAEQPDLNWSNPELVAEMMDTLRYWLDLGVDGFRMDVIHCIGKDPALPDVPQAVAKIPYCALNDHESTHQHLQSIRSLLESYPGDRVMVGEVFLLNARQVAAYYGQDDELQMCFNFLPLFTSWDAVAWRERIDEVNTLFLQQGHWPTWALSNHDQPRHRTRYGGSEHRARAAAFLLLALPGTPFLYAGEELGLEDAEVPIDARVDPGGRDGCRAPIPWSAEPPYGWKQHDNWLPWPPDRGERNPEVQQASDTSILQLYRSLLAARRNHASLRSGSFEWMPSSKGILFWKRELAGDFCYLAINFSDQPQRLQYEGALRVELSSQRTNEGFGESPGMLAPDEALLLIPKKD